MHALRDGKLWKAVGLAVGLFALVPMGAIDVNVQGTSFWSSYFWPTMSPLFVAIPVVVAAIIAGVLSRPCSPRRAAWVGGLGGFACISLPHFMSWPLGKIHGLQALSFAVFVSGHFALPLAVGCWVGADYWRRESLQGFWRGSSGAVLRGGIVAGVSGAAISVLFDLWVEPRLRAGYTPVIPAFYFIPHFARIPELAVLTAALARWRPSPMVGAFAGAGIAFGFAGAVFPVVAPLALPLSNLLSSLDLYGRLVIGLISAAIAGSFAGRWEPEPLPDEQTE
jgi:hypothetical protein